MSEIVILSGSPSENSRSEKVLRYLGERMEQQQFSVTHISVKDVPAEDLMFSNFKSPDVIRIAEQISQAKGVIVGTPVYKASYSGVLKALIDIMPQDILEDTPALPVMTGGSMSHLLAMEYALKPLLATLKGVTVKGLYFMDSQIDKTAEQPLIDEDAFLRTEKQLAYFIRKVRREQTASV
ncbi:FMN reductase [Bhargavaea cecembensis]|uniref:FMN reductase n=1 Tax=Bhargavaea cecembensis TaxID=394098 RepID=A0A163ESX8_9BACL|nr:NADPH-dependent FMN reductase [Bhargavaea cecembensis]KZE37121.1 FMN reductase [Bhargavaea cecembensis]